MKHRLTVINRLCKLVAETTKGDVQDRGAKYRRAQRGHARATAMTAEQRKQVAAKGAQARWEQRKVAIDAAP